MNDKKLVGRRRRRRIPTSTETSLPLNDKPSNHYVTTTTLSSSKADKGGAVVVWRKDLYQAEAERQLSDRSSYKLLNKDPSSNHQTLIKTTVNNFIKNNDLPPNATNLINSNSRTSQFYMLPKIHKQNIPGRPIISAHSCPTAFISQYLDDLLRPMVEALPTYVKRFITRTSHLW